MFAWRKPIADAKADLKERLDELEKTMSSVLSNSSAKLLNVINSGRVDLKVCLSKAREGKHTH